MSACESAATTWFWIWRMSSATSSFALLILPIIAKLVKLIYVSTCAAVAELADALDSKDIFRHFRSR
jgi:hypothetical protein